MSQVEAPRGKRRGIFSGLRRALTEVRPTETQLDLTRDIRERVAFTAIVPTAEWSNLTRTMEEASRGRRNVSEASEIISNWGAAGLVEIGRSENTVGHPFKLQPREGYKPPIATDAKLPGGRDGIQITIDRVIKSDPEPKKERVLARV